MDIMAIALGAGFLLFLCWGIAVVARHYRLAERPVRFPLMAARLGLSMKRIGDSEFGVHLPTAARLCLKCKRAQECDEWLAAANGRTEPPTFCANAVFLRLTRRAAETPY